MNLNAYDSMTPMFTTTWIVPNSRKLYSNIIPYYKYYTFLKRYNNEHKNNDYYIALSNKETSDRQWYRTYTTNSNAIKIDLSPIWYTSSLRNITNKQEIIIKLDNEFDDGIVYYIDI